MAGIQRRFDTKWTQEQVRQLVSNQKKPHYQAIQLPFGLSTKGSDRTASSQIIYPSSLSGKSVLDIGCQIGHFSHDACHLGAKRVLGVDINEGAIEEARQIADCLGHPSEFRLLDIERENINEQFNIVLCLNVIQHFKNPLLVLEKLIEATKDTLILELPAFGRRDCKKMKLSAMLGKLLDRLPVMYAGKTGVNGEFYSPKFGITASALENILLYHRNTFARVDTRPSEFKQRYIAFAHKRRFGRMILLSGPPASGKSTLIRKLNAGELPQVAARLNITEGESWRHINASDMMQVTDPFTPRAMVHYSFINPYVRRCRTYERDELLDPIVQSDELTYVTMWVRPDVVLKRFDAHKIDPRTVNGKYEGSPRYLDRRTYLEDPLKLIEYYRTWFAYLKRLNVEPIILDNNAGGDFISYAQWEAQARAIESGTV